MFVKDKVKLEHPQNDGKLLTAVGKIGVVVVVAVLVPSIKCLYLYEEEFFKMDSCRSFLAIHF
jgi:hypothetical protein